MEKQADPTNEPVQITQSGLSATVTLNRSSTLNSVNNSLLAELTEAYTRLSTDPTIAVIVLEGAGRSFCAGADVYDPPGTAPEDASHETRIWLAREGERAIRAIRNARPVTVARVHGHAIGGGLLLALANDVRIAETETKFRLPELPSGIPMTWGGTPLLVDELGASAARELILFGTEVTAPEAKQLGLAHAIADGHVALDREVVDRVAHLVSLPKEAILATKRQFRALQPSRYPEEDLVTDADTYVRLMSADWDPRQRGTVRFSM